jgi:cytoskeleton protein RodZ
MPEIGDQLREARLRNRIDITEVEAATKIRAKYLRALENEEWDLLPGPTFVKTFLRTYADYLGLDSRVLVEEYRQRYERLAPQELTPFGTNLGGRRARPRRPLIAPWMMVVAGVLVLVAVLYLLGRWGDDTQGDEQAAQPTATATPRAAAKKKQQARRKAAAAKPTRVRLQVRATGPVSVCLESAGGTPLIRNQTLDAGQSSRTFRGRRFTVSFGTGAAVMRVNGKAFAVSDDSPVGYELRPGAKPRRLPEGRRPTCSG